MSFERLLEKTTPICVSGNSDVHMIACSCCKYVFDRGLRTCWTCAGRSLLRLTVQEVGLHGGLHEGGVGL